ncbi:hypothetical protein Pla110_39080 [Polystyrenella longa]|uniref:Uncharacterized protein n=1 Tax=Polystyrenella longa TaxID=2528007 RepID=A0A518CSF3_9PLAN|nr:hypothetical protein Pla110_39080 [Polystyrenella longa]
MSFCIMSSNNHHRVSDQVLIRIDLIILEFKIENGLLFYRADAVDDSKASLLRRK